MLKKAITIVLIFIVLFEFMQYNCILARSEEALNSYNEGEATINNTKINKDGTETKEEEKKGYKANLFLQILTGVLGFVLVIIPSTGQALLTLAVLPDNLTKMQIFTIEDVLLGRFDLFNANYMDTSNILTMTREGTVYSSTNKIIKKNVAGWFYAIRNFSLVALMAILIAVGILMAVSTIASDRAKYKNMLINWVVSLAILMFLPYIMSVAFAVCDTTVGVIRDVSENLMSVKVDDTTFEKTKGLNFEKALMMGRVNENGEGYDGILTKIQKAHAGDMMALVIVYCVLVYYQWKFFFLYLKRMLTIGFLVVISPLITITYSIDKARDNQAQAYKTWIKEFLVNVFIQPLHAFIFVIFMYSVYGIMERAPLLAVVFLAALSRGEQIVRNIFKIQRTSAVGFLGKGKR